MIDFLVKKLIRNYEKTEDAAVRASYGMLAGAIGIICNMLLFAAKLLTGMLVNSISIMADAFNNLSDAASSVIGFAGARMAQKPADGDHPFGHGRIEYIAAFVVAFLVIQVGFSLFKTSVVKIFRPERMSFHIATVIVLLISVAVKLWLSCFNRKLGRRISSQVMLATATDALGDCAATGATTASIVVFGVWGVNIDGFVGTAVSVLVMLAGINIAKDTLAPLIGQAIDPEVYREITEFVEQYDGIIGSHDLIVHDYGPSRRMASIHAEVPSHVPIEESHEVVDRIERDALRCLGIFLVIHMDPVETENSHVDELREMTCQILRELDERLSFHDFRVVEGKRRISLIFDLVMPRDYHEDMKESLKEEVCRRISQREPRCQCVITAEYSYQSEERQ